MKGAPLLLTCFHLGRDFQKNLSRSVAGSYGAVMLSAAKHLAAHRARPFAEFTLSEANGLKVTRFGTQVDAYWAILAVVLASFFCSI